MITFEEAETTHSPIVRISVIGVGGAGGNSVTMLLGAELEHVECLAMNTDLQALQHVKAHHKLQIGIKSAKGLGAGANPDVGKRAAEEDLSEILERVQESDIVFLTGGLGGGTGSGALPVIARALRERDMLTIAVVTKPFSFEGKRRMAVANEAEALLKKEVDTLIVVPNQKLLAITQEKLSLVQAFGKVNEIICNFVKGIADIITRPGHINVDFADVKAIMKGMGPAVMGTGRAQGVDRAYQAALMAVESPLLDAMSIRGARAVLVNIAGSSNLGLQEMSEAIALITDEVHEDAKIIVGSVIDDSLGEEVQVTVIATGCIDTAQIAAQQTHVLQTQVSQAQASQVQTVQMQAPAVQTASVIQEASVVVSKVQIAPEEPAVQAVAITPAPVTETVEVAQEKPQSFDKPSFEELLLSEHQPLLESKAEQDELEVPALLRKLVQEKQQLQQKE